MDVKRKWYRRGLMVLVLGVVVVGLLLSPWLRPRRGPEPSELAPWPVAVVPGVYLLGKTYPAAVYAVDTTDGLVLIDSGVDASAELITRQLADLGLDVKRLRAILLTHAHADHSLGAARLRELTGAKVYAGRGDCRPLRQGGPPEALISIHPLQELKLHPTPVDVELTGGETVEVGDARFEVLATPGHTPGSVCYLLQRDGQRALFTGDVILCLTLSNKETLGTYTAYLPPVYGGDARDYLASLRRLRALPLPDLVLPGHPRMDQVPQSPRLTQEHWHALLDQGIHDLEQLLARYEADGANFLDGGPKKLLPGLHYLGDFGGSAVYCLDCPKGLFLFDAPGGAYLVEFLAERFQALGWQERKLVAVLLTSAGKEATAGLAALVRSTGCKVVAPRAGLDVVQRMCPAGTEVLTEAGLDKNGWFKVQALPLRGRGRAPLAYRIRWADKTVLVSGRIPVKLTIPAGAQLLSEVSGSEGNRGDYQRSLHELRGVNPDLWLPAVPVHGQNANLYDREWEDVIQENLYLLSR
jgi:metallo-beta-lactamase class B